MKGWKTGDKPTLQCVRSPAPGKNSVFRLLKKKGAFNQIAGTLDGEIAENICPTVLARHRCAKTSFTVAKAIDLKHLDPGSMSGLAYDLCKLPTGERFLRRTIGVPAGCTNDYAYRR